MDHAYNLREQGDIVREQQQAAPDPIAEARHIMSDAILAHVLLALSDAGFYEYLVAHGEVSLERTALDLGLDPFTFRALMEYLVGCGALAGPTESACDDRLVPTPKGHRYFNVYTRGVMNVYLGGYGRVLHRLGEVLTRKVSLDDRSLARSTRHAAAGTAYSTCAFTIPAVFNVLEKQGLKTCLDLGCGTGEFLIQYMQRSESARGIGVDMSAEALEQARLRAGASGLSDRLTFVEDAVGPSPLKISPSMLESVEVVTSMYMLHEFGRDGRGAVVEIVRALKTQFPGRKLLALEVEACDPFTYSRDNAPAHHGRLDYRLIHQLSRQGLPQSKEAWHSIFEDAGCRVVEPGMPTGGSLIYVVQM